MKKSIFIVLLFGFLLSFAAVAEQQATDEEAADGGAEAAMPPGILPIPGYGDDLETRGYLTGDWNGVRIYDDYGHHPVEIGAVLAAARSAASGRVIAVVQPHRYTRLQSLFDEFCGCFNEADTVLVADVYPAGEEPIEGVNRDALVEGLRAGGHRDARPLASEADLAALISELARPDDLVICLGAGSITHWANSLPDQLNELGGSG